MPAWLQRKKSNSVGWQILESTTVPANSGETVRLEKIFQEVRTNLKNDGITTLTGKDVAAPVNGVLVVVVVRKQSGVVALLNHDESNLGLVVGLQRRACLRDRQTSWITREW
jgi:hypothetical protein